MNKFAGNLRRLREDRRIYQRELADFLDVSVSTYQNYEKGIHEPNIDKLIALADCFGVTLDELVGREPGQGLEGRFPPAGGAPLP